jgi:hypothetical protein
MTSIIFKRVGTIEELKQIKELQNRNLKGNLSSEERDQEGFVTAEYSLEFLSFMLQFEPSIIALIRE